MRQLLEIVSVAVAIIACAFCIWQFYAKNSLYNYRKLDLNGDGFAETKSERYFHSDRLILRVLSDSREGSADISGAIFYPSSEISIVIGAQEDEDHLGFFQIRSGTNVIRIRRDFDGTLRILEEFEEAHIHFPEH